MLDIMDWSKERPRHNDVDRYILEVQKAVPKTKAEISKLFFIKIPYNIFCACAEVVLKKQA